MTQKRPEMTRTYQVPHTEAPHRESLKGDLRTTTYILRPVHLIAGALTCIAATLIVTGAISYQVMRSGMVAEVNAERTEVALQYQDRIARLRAEIERLNSRQLVDRESVEIQVMDVLRRQQDLNQRHTIVADLMARAESVGIYLNTGKPVPAQKPAIDEGRIAAAPKGDRTAMGGENEVISEPVKALGLRDASRKPFDPLSVLQGTEAPTDEPLKKKTEKRAALDALKADISEMGTESTAAVDAITVATESRIEDILGITKPLVPNLNKAVRRSSSLGGPFEPLSQTSFADRLHRANTALDTLKRVKFAALRLPLKRPVRTGTLSSGYGPRMDPFLNRLAMHSGLDFKAPYGARVYSAAPGTVIFAGWKGGYGKMVEIRHANGLVTRYAHLSKIRTSDGNHVVAGDVIGNIGSTGRSTGPHLHYEVRQNDRPTNPATFLRAGERLAKLSL
ncbi:peptidoglycan DD-metalloendopeptidase family protein [Roseibium sp.]|uniref:peptidoglycan DD-metalloendopeptidase family protein n=1 Tax=Roseibium sp. TaxID=1936156 RepID=UPI003D0C1A0F